MVRLAMLLVGASAFRRIWWALPVAGAAWMLLGLWLIADASDGVLIVTAEVLGFFLMIQGAAVAFSAAAKRARVRALLLWRAGGLFVLGVMIVLPLGVDHGIPDRVLFGLAFLIDGALRTASAYVVRFANWQLGLAAGLAEIGVAWIVMGNWPIHHHYTVPMCLGVVLIASGWSLVKLGSQLRRLTPGASITSLPMFAARGWYRARSAVRPSRVESDRSDRADTPMTLYVWTPVGSSQDPQRRLLVDRYIAAVDAKGVVSTGHSALECLPDVYISHYPAVEIDHAPDDFARLLRAGTENDVPGEWQPSYAIEAARWCDADQRVDFHVYDPAALRAFWEIYRADATYNLTSRSCSTVTSLAIESALEGVLGGRRPLLTFFRLLVDSNLWMAAMLRRRGATMAWTPGLVLDYARLLKVIVARRVPARGHAAQAQAAGVQAR